MKDKTILCNDGDEYWKHQGAIVPPMYQNSLFAFESWDKIDQAFSTPSQSYIYTRLHNPTSRLAEQKIAAIAQAEDAKLTGSGMGAISAAILHFVSHGDHIITIKNTYSPTNQFINGFLSEKCNISSTFVDGKNPADFEEAITDRTKLIYLESPASITMELQDLRAVVDIAKRHGIHTVIDNTWATPLLQKCIPMGIDLEVHSVSKYLCGHSDVVAGVIIGAKHHLDAILTKEHALLGAKMAPFESWLLLRSLRTLPIRMKALEETAMTIATALEQQEAVARVAFPGLSSFPQYKLGRSQMSGYGSLMSIELATTDLSEIKAFVEGLQLFHLGVSWGGHESLVYAPVISYAKELPPDQFAAMGIIPGMIRLSLGMEDATDLLDDLLQALQHISPKHNLK